MTSVRGWQPRGGRAHRPRSSGGGAGAQRSSSAHAERGSSGRPPPRPRRGPGAARARGTVTWWPSYLRPEAVLSLCPPLDDRSRVTARANGSCNSQIQTRGPQLCSAFALRRPPPARPWPRVRRGSVGTAEGHGPLTRSEWPDVPRVGGAPGDARRGAGLPEDQGCSVALVEPPARVQHGSKREACLILEYSF